MSLGEGEERKMIPKVIHYCWFGNNPLPDIAIRCIESWKRLCPHYEIRLWSEDNFDLNSCPYILEAYEERRWAFVSDYARLKIIYESGGIYLDTDVEVLHSFDNLLSHPCFLGTEIGKNGGGLVNTGLGFGAEKKNRIVKAMLEQYEGIHFRGANGVCDATPCPERNTAPLVELGFKYSRNTVWKTDDVVVYPPEYFSPMNYLTGEARITENSYSIHHYSALWISDKDRDMMRRIEELEKNNMRVVGQVKKQWMLYKMAKEEGKAKSFVWFVGSKIRLKLGNKR